MKKPIPQDIWDLWEYSFLQTIIKRKSKRLIKQIAESGSLFIPVNDSINFHLHISDIRNAIFKQIDRIHFENQYKRCITVIGNDIRTEKGFLKMRLLNVVKMYSLSEEQFITLFSLRRSYSLPHSFKSLTIYITTGPFIGGLVIPVYEEQLSDLQATRTIQWITVMTGITPVIDALKEEFDRNDTILALREDSNSDDWSFESQKRFEQVLRSKGREIVSHCRNEANRLCSEYSTLSTKQKLIFYSLHHFTMQLVAPNLYTNISTQCKADLLTFEQSWKFAQNLTLEDLHVSSHFQLNFSPALRQLNEMYFLFRNHPEVVLPLNILTAWDRLLCDIRYIINTEVVNRQTMSLTDLQTITVSTDDLIGIVTYLFLHTDLILCVPSQLIFVDAFCPFDLSITASGYTYSIIETAVMWINEYAKTHSV